MTVTRRIRLESLITFALLAAGLSVAAIGFLALFGWILDAPVLTMWKIGTQPMAPSTAGLSMLFGAALCLGARMPHRPVAVLLITSFGWAGAITSLLLFALRFLGVYGSAELLSLRITGTFGDAPIGYISPITAFCFLLANGSLLLLASLSHGARGYWRSWLAWGFGGLVSLVSYIYLLAYVFGPPILFGKILIHPALNTSLIMLIMGLALLVLAARNTVRPDDSSEADTLSLLPYTLIFFVFAAGILAVTYNNYRETERRFRRQVESQLIAVSELKTDELVRWRIERLEDANLSHSALITAAVRRLLETPRSVPAQREMRELFGKYMRYIGYDRAFLLDAKGVNRMSVPNTAEPAAAILAERTVASLRLGQVTLQDFYRDEHDQRVYLALIVPILDTQDGNRPLGAIVLRIDPSIVLYPLIKRWPAPSTSAETLLVRRDGNDVLFLNDLRFRANAALALRMPLTNTELPAAKAVLGQRGIVDGVDYRGMPVIAAVRAVPDSPWRIVTRIGTAEVYAPLHERLWLTLLLVSVLVCSAGAVAIFLWRQQRLVIYRRQLELTSLLREREERHRTILRTVMDGFWLVDRQGRLLEVNETYSRMSGYSEQELLSMRVFDLEALETAEDIATHLQNTTAQGEDRFESRHRRKDGSIFEVEVSIQYQPSEDGRFVIFLQDITERKQAMEALRQSEQKFRTLAEAMPQIVWITRPDGWNIYFNQQWVDFTGLTLEESYGQGWIIPFHPDDQQRAWDAWQHAIKNDGSYSLECRLRRADGIYRWWLVRGVSLHDANGKVINWFGTCTDIQDLKESEEKLHLAASVFSHAREGIMITAADGAIIDVNDAFSDITGYSRDEVLGKNPRLLKSGRHENDFYAAMWRDLIKKDHWYGEIWNRRKNGEVYPELLTISTVPNGPGNPRRYLGLFSDITMAKEHEQKLERSAHYDALTSLPNRVLLADRLHQAMAHTRRRGQGLAVAYLDLDGFKAINDKHGHEVGDQLLIAVATRMKQALREGDTLARLGGDEFVAVLLDSGGIDASVPMLSRLLAAAAQPVQYGDITLQVSASLGVTFYAQAEDIDADQLLRQADQSMYQAKLAGKNRYHFFDAEQDSRIRSHHESLDRICRALSAREFVLYYQPKVNMRTGTVIGAEALIRWQHPERGLLQPDMFLPMIEDHPLAIELGEWVIDTALTQMELWHAAGLNIPVSVNLGSRQLQQTDFVERLSALLSAHPNVSPGDLELEVLETSAMEDLSKVSRVIDASRKIGVSFALDDFGTGYSSLTYLKRLAVSILKIDQSFVRDMIKDPDDLAIVEGVIGLATAFRRQVIAEGVETVEQGSLLLKLGCDLAQGYGIARPMPALELPGWSVTWRHDPVWTEQLFVSHDALQ
ncbi:MAG: EAL domain-containing protein [Methylococcaceae bacterium]